VADAGLRSRIRVICNGEGWRQNTAGQLHRGARNARANMDVPQIDLGRSNRWNRENRCLSGSLDACRSRHLAILESSYLCS